MYLLRSMHDDLAPELFDRITVGERSAFQPRLSSYLQQHLPVNHHEVIVNHSFVLQPRLSRHDGRGSRYHWPCFLYHYVRRCSSKTISRLKIYRVYERDLPNVYATVKNKLAVMVPEVEEMREMNIARVLYLLIEPLDLIRRLRPASSSRRD